MQRPSCGEENDRIASNMRVVLDTNVLVSAFLWQGNAKEIFILAKKGIIISCATSSTIDELERVLSYPKFKKILIQRHMTPYTLLTAFLKVVTLYPSVRLEHSYIHNDPSDNAFLSCALVAHADYIISGDHHLLTLKLFHGIPILTPMQFLKRMKAE